MDEEMEYHLSSAVSVLTTRPDGKNRSHKQRGDRGNVLLSLTNNFFQETKYLMKIKDLGILRAIIFTALQDDITERLH